MWRLNRVQEKVTLHMPPTVEWADWGDKQGLGELHGVLSYHRWYIANTIHHFIPASRQAHLRQCKVEPLNSHWMSWMCISKREIKRYSCWRSNWAMPRRVWRLIRTKEDEMCSQQLGIWCTLRCTLASWSLYPEGEMREAAPKVLRKIWG